MTVLGAHELVRPKDEAAAEKAEPVRPGLVSDPLLAAIADRAKTSKRGKNLEEIVHADAMRALERELRRVEAVRSSTTLAALAQSQAALDDVPAAVDAAREALELSVRVYDDGHADWVDPSSARIAAEILARHGYIETAYEGLKRAPVSASLCVTFASAALAVGREDEALDALDSYVDNWAVSAFRGYLYALCGQYQNAIGDLRRALREEPNDADSLFNLAISLWNVGSTQKAVRAALRATKAAPGRKDISLFYLDLLLNLEDVDRLKQEIALLEKRKVVPDAKFLEVQARSLLLQSEWTKAITKLGFSAEAAENEGDKRTEGRVRSNLVRLKHLRERLSRAQAVKELASLTTQFPGNDAVVVNFAEVAHRRRDASLLRKALSEIESKTTEIRCAYLRHQIAVLEGDNDAAALAAEEWFGLEPDNPMAAAATMIAVGIGLSKWDRAVQVADYALARFPDHRSVINHAGYVLAMGKRAKEAIQFLAPEAEGDFVISATLGLAYLADGEFDRGMRIYRDAAEIADNGKLEWRSLMTVYQGMVVRQLGLDKVTPQQVIEAVALVPVPLPDDWEDNPEFLRVHAVCEKNGYPWPPSF